MAIKFLIDTNVFLEILLNQEKKELCKLYLNNKFETYNSFVNDVLFKIEVLSIQKINYSEITNIANQFKLDFDDAYQVKVAENRNLTIATLDKDFEKVSHFYKIDFIR